MIDDTNTVFDTLFDEALMAEADESGISRDDILKMMSLDLIQLVAVIQELGLHDVILSRLERGSEDWHFVRSLFFKEAMVLD
jgi:hypothetical protein